MVREQVRDIEVVRRGGKLYLVDARCGKNPRLPQRPLHRPRVHRRMQSRYLPSQKQHPTRTFRPKYPLARNKRP